MSRLERSAVVVACLLGLAPAGCGVDATGVVGGGSAVSVAADQTGADMCLVGPDGIQVVHRHDIDIGPAQILSEPDAGGGADDPLATIMELLASGATEGERERGLTTEVSGGTRLVIEDRSPLVNALSSVPVEGVELAQPIAVTIISTFLPTETATEQIACTLERYLARSGIVAQVITRHGSDEMGRPGAFKDPDETAG